MCGNAAPKDSITSIFPTTPYSTNLQWLTQNGINTVSHTWSYPKSYRSHDSSANRYLLSERRDVQIHRALRSKSPQAYIEIKFSLKSPATDEIPYTKVFSSKPFNPDCDERDQLSGKASPLSEVWESFSVLDLKVDFTETCLSSDMVVGEKNSTSMQHHELNFISSLSATKRPCTWLLWNFADVNGRWN